MKLEKMIERNCCDRIRNASIRDGLPTWAVILTNRELTAEDRAAILLGYDGSETDKIGNCETGLAFDVQRRQTPDFVGDEQEKVDGDIGKAGMEGKQTEKGRTNRRKSRPPI
jgi:hypothetical protein